MWRQTAIVTVQHVAVTPASHQLQTVSCNIVQEIHLMSKQNSLPNVDHVVRLPERDRWNLAELSACRRKGA